MITNLYTAPRCTPPVRTWSANATLVTGTDGLITVTPVDTDSSFYHFSALPWNMGEERFGKYVCYLLGLENTDDIDHMSIASASDLAKGIVTDRTGWIAGCLAKGHSSVHELNIQTEHVPSVKLLGCGLYTAADWELLRDMIRQGLLDAPILEGGMLPA